MHTNFSSVQNLVFWYAHKICKAYPFNFNEVVNECYLIYQETVRKYNPSKGVKFSTYYFSSLRKIPRIIFQKNATQELKEEGAIEIEDALIEKLDVQQALTKVSEDARNIAEYLMYEKRWGLKTDFEERGWGRKKIKNALDELKKELQNVL